MIIYCNIDYGIQYMATILRSLGTVITLMTMVVVLNVTAKTERNNGTDYQQHHGNQLVPRFLNGHYITWPITACTKLSTRRMTNCDVNMIPPYISYKPSNVVFTRMQMAGDRAFVVSPRYKYVIEFTWVVSKFFFDL